MSALDPDCFTDEVELLYDPVTGDLGATEARVFSYITPWVTYQVTFNNHHLVARIGQGPWLRKFGRHHDAIIKHYNLSERFKPLGGISRLVNDAWGKAYGH